jgi:hypothetical protein
MDDKVLKAGVNIIGHVMEQAVTWGAYYMDKCNRTTLTATDINYGMKYAARNVHQTCNADTTPDIINDIMNEEEEEEDEDEWEECEEDDESFVRYIGDDEICIAMNACYDSWDSWVPESYAESLLKKSIDKVGDDQTEEGLLLADTEEN